VWLLPLLLLARSFFRLARTGICTGCDGQTRTSCGARGYCMVCNIMNVLELQRARAGRKQHGLPRPTTTLSAACTVLEF
jgi:hypothetical protein